MTGTCKRYDKLLAKICFHFLKKNIFGRCMWIHTGIAFSIWNPIRTEGTSGSGYCKFQNHTFFGASKRVIAHFQPCLLGNLHIQKFVFCAHFCIFALFKSEIVRFFNCVTKCAIFQIAIFSNLKKK